MPQRVLFITADQQRRDSLPAYGLDFVQAPALDRLAREGVVFDRAHTPAPLCVPMRACMLTGLTPARARRGRQQRLVLAAHALVGHRTWLPISRRPLSARCTSTRGTIHTASPNGSRRRTSATTTARMTTPSGWSRRATSGSIRQAIPGYHEGMGAMPSNLPTELHLDTFIGDRAAAWLREHAQEPFFAWVSFNSPHDPYDPPAELADLYQDAPIPEPPAPGRPRLARPLSATASRDTSTTSCSRWTTAT